MGEDESAANNCEQATVTVMVASSGLITIDLTSGLTLLPTAGGGYAIKRLRDKRK